MKEKEVEKILKALANRRRLTMLCHLKKMHEDRAGNIAGKPHLSLSATSRHLNILERAGILEKEQSGLEVFYRIGEPISPFVSRLIMEL
jgi:DNA-binding transcriptional ArsR family regulator